MEYLRDLWIGTDPLAGAGTPVGLGEGLRRIGPTTDTGRLGSVVPA